MKFFDLQHPWFRPVWRRLLVTAVAVVWTGVELAGGAFFWATLFGALSVYCIHQFFIAFDPPEDEAAGE
ncbi:hypothetical protein GE300_15245 [Rhodobacteraceae bacterium 2CG4]|uniref:DUF3329 domain-containing protein n=1 Tax=Halovulum marinum TaxID=2662447 RepID=A0A6L5Z3R8_9RHOB|nr:hypothetical protein [Halovulum marinum]MSU90949.1 hypothetical protein [Halovulum marinum]